MYTIYEFGEYMRTLCVHVLSTIIDQIDNKEKDFNEIIYYKATGMQGHIRY